MKPTPKLLALLVSLIGIGGPWSAAASGDDAGISMSSTSDSHARESAIRDALGLQEMPVKISSGDLLGRTAKASAINRLAAAPVKPAHVESGHWDHTALGLGKGAVSVTNIRSKRDEEAGEAARVEQLAKIRAILGIAAPVDIAAVREVHPVNRGIESLTAPVVVTVARAQATPHEIAAVSTDWNDVEVAEAVYDTAQPLSPTAEPLFGSIEELLLHQGPGPRKPRHYRDEPLPMIADRFATGARRDDRRFPLLTLLETTPMSEWAPLEQLQAVITQFDEDLNETNLVVKLSGEPKISGEAETGTPDPLADLLLAIDTSHAEDGLIIVSRTGKQQVASGLEITIAAKAANDERLDVAAADKDAGSSEARIELQSSVFSTIDKQVSVPLEQFQKIGALYVSPFQSGGNLLPLMALSPIPAVSSVDIAAVAIATSKDDAPSASTIQSTNELFRDVITLREVLSGWVDIFDPTLNVPKVVTSAKATLVPESFAAIDIFDPALETATVLANQVAKHSASETIDIFDPRLDAPRAYKSGPKNDPTSTPAIAVGLRESFSAGVTAPNVGADEIPRLSVVEPVPSARAMSPPKAAVVKEREDTIEQAMARVALIELKRASTAVVGVLVDAAASSLSPPSPARAASADAPDTAPTQMQADQIREIPLSQDAAEALARAIEESDENRANPLQGERVALSNSKLDQMRGGFETGSGLKVSFGIERAVYINGNLVTTTSLNIADLSKLSAGQAQAAALNGASLGLIQNGPSNSFQPGAISASNIGTVIQNTLNDQKIQALTLINASVNSLDLIKRANVQSSIQSALIDSLRR